MKFQIVSYELWCIVGAYEVYDVRKRSIHRSKAQRDERKKRILPMPLEEPIVALLPRVIDRWNAQRNGRPTGAKSPK